jgi:hypothetical protein
MLPDRFDVFGSLALYDVRDFTPENVGDSPAIAADGVGIAVALCAVSVEDANRNELEELRSGVRAVRQGDGKRNPVESDLEFFDACHGDFQRLFAQRKVPRSASHRPKMRLRHGAIWFKKARSADVDGESGVN